MDQPVATVATRSRDEVESTILAFTPDELLRLRKVSWNHAFRCTLEANDLLQEAIVRALDGSRKCPANISVVKFLAEAMRSIAHGESEKTENQVVPISLLSADESKSLNRPDRSPSIEENVISEESAAILHDRILSLFQEGAPERDMVECIMDGWSREELQELLNLEKTAYNSMRKLIRRRLNKAYPEGWNHDRR